MINNIKSIMRNTLIPSEIIVNKIFLIREKKVMLDRDLAILYGVKNKVLNQAVKRNFERFPEDFMFQLTKQEMNVWKSQIVTSKGDTKGLRKLPHVFTERGVAMLSSVLNSKRAIQVNIEIIRTFARLRQMLIDYKDLRFKIEDMEQRYDKKFKMIFDVMKRLINEEEKPKKIIGFHYKK